MWRFRSVMMVPGVRLCYCWGDVGCVGSGCPRKCPDQRGQGEELRLFDFSSMV